MVTSTLDSDIWPTGSQKMNKNYLSGRRLEYEIMKKWEEKGYSVVRSAGSHGIWDVCAVRWDRPVELIQCKVTKDKRVAEAMIRMFKSSSPLLPSRYFHQTLLVKVKGTKEPLSATI